MNHNEILSSFILITLDFADEETIYIDIGVENNTQTTAGKGSGNPTTIASTPDILDCQLPKAFWMSWGGDEVKVSVCYSNF